MSNSFYQNALDHIRHLHNRSRYNSDIRQAAINMERIVQEALYLRDELYEARRRIAELEERLEDLEGFDIDIDCDTDLDL